MEQVDIPAQEFDEDEEQRLINEGNAGRLFHNVAGPDTIKNTKHGRRIHPSSMT